MKKKSSKKKNNNSKASLDNMKYEIANEFGVSLSGRTASEANGKVGGEITKRLVNEGKNKMSGSSKNNS